MENCASLTTLIKNLGGQKKLVDDFVVEEKWDEAISEMDIADDLIKDKAEFLRWRMLEKTGEQEFKVSMHELVSTYKGFEFVDVSPNGQYLAFGNKDRFLVMNLETGQMEKDVAPHGRQNEDLRINHFYIDDYGSVDIRAIESPESASGKYGIYSFMADGETILKISSSCPRVYSRDRKVGSFNIGTLTLMPSVFAQGPDFAREGYSLEEIIDIKTDENQHYTITLSDQGNLHYWSIPRQTHLHRIAEKVKSFEILPGDINYLILDKTKFYRLYFQDSSDPGARGHFKYKMLAEFPEGQGYVAMAKSTDNSHVFAITSEGRIDIFDLEKAEKISEISLASRLSGLKIKDLKCGINNKLVIALEGKQGEDLAMERRVIIFEPKWRDK